MNVKEKEEYLVDSVSSSNGSIANGEVIIGTITGLDHQGKAIVDFSGNVTNKAISAISTVSISLQNTGRQVALLFENNDLKKPIVVGLIHNPLQDILDNFEIANADNENVENSESEIKADDNSMTTKVDDMLIDGERVVFEARKEIVLKCGESSITLTKAGKILIKGKYLLNRSSGVNRIMGGSVQIN